MANQYPKRSPLVVRLLWKLYIAAVTDPTRMISHLQRPDCTLLKCYNVGRT